MMAIKIRKNIFATLLRHAEYVTFLHKLQIAILKTNGIIPTPCHKRYSTEFIDNHDASDYEKAISISEFANYTNLGNFINEKQIKANTYNGISIIHT